MIVLIPAYEPGPALVELIAALRESVRIVVVDDGSGPASDAVFEAARAAGADVLGHASNRGKGAALRTGLRHVQTAYPGELVVTADADGQHTVADILRVGEATAADDATLVLGCRTFGGADVPLRSRAGNAAARAVFRAAAGWALSDTQTGLRGLPPAMLPWLLQQRGERFEYEQNVLLRVRRSGWRTREVPIATVYLDDNASSHFRPVVDTLRVGLPLLLFAASSLLAFAVDTTLLLVLTALTGWLVPSIVLARVLSAGLNFTINRRVVFAGTTDTAGTARAAGRYAVLAAVLLASNVAWMSALTAAGTPLLVAKLVTEAALFLLGYALQRSVVFPRTSPPKVVSAVNASLRNGEGDPTRMVSATNTTRRTP